jgi:holo-[acyl-carrier protein] synthase
MPSPAAAHSSQPLAPAAPTLDNPGMTIIGHGIDIVDIDRIARMVHDHGPHFLDRCFTKAEQAYCLPPRRAHEHLAGRFAAKEAILKALGTGWRGQIAWTDMEILNDPAGKPVLRLEGETARLAAEQGIVRWHLSISHTEKTAVASAIAES